MVSTQALLSLRIGRWTSFASLYRVLRIDSRGDYLEITVHNELQDNGTAIHWHGVRQLNSVGADGVPGKMIETAALECFTD